MESGFATMYPPDFLNRMETRLGSSFSDFLNALHSVPPVSVRLNPLKKGNGVLQSYIESPILWVENGYYLNERPIFTLDPLFHAGAYYVQEASSMLTGLAFPKNDDPLLILDLCAAPGGKTTLLASLMNDNSVLVANEVIKSRKPILAENVIRWGHPNVIVTSLDSGQLVQSGLKFDFILADAPCSGEGLWRKDPKAITEWSPEHVSFCADRQKRILADAVKLLKKGGKLVYSTCTYNEEENDRNIAFLLEQSHLSLCKLEINKDWGITEIPFSKEGVAYLCYPHKLKGEGFFLSVFQASGTPDETEEHLDFNPKKPKNNPRLTELYGYLDEENEYIIEDINGFIRAYPAKTHEHAKIVEQYLKSTYGGVLMGEFKGKDFIPNHELALSVIISPRVPTAELNQELALRYLKRELSDLPEIGNGWWRVAYQGLGLGWLKKINSRINNYLPNHWRVRMDVDYENI